MSKVKAKVKLGLSNKKLYNLVFDADMKAEIEERLPSNSGKYDIAEIDEKEVHIIATEHGSSILKRGAQEGWFVIWQTQKNADTNLRKALFSPATMGRDNLVFEIDRLIVRHDKVSKDPTSGKHSTRPPLTLVQEPPPPPPSPEGKLLISTSPKKTIQSALDVLSQYVDNGYITGISVNEQGQLNVQITETLVGQTRKE